MRTLPVVRMARWPQVVAGALMLLSGVAWGKAPAARPPAPAARRAARSAVQALTAAPDRLTLQGPYAEAHVLVAGHLAGGGTRDVSDEVALSVADPKVAAVDEDRTVRPRGDGRTTLVARLQGREVRVPVEVRGVAKAGPPRFLTDVLPLLRHSHPNVIRDACRTLAALGNKANIPAIEPLLNHTSKEVRKDAQDAIDALRAKR